MKIIAFPFAGGHKYSFSFLKASLPENIDLVVVEYPGRGSRVKEKLVDTIGTLMKDVFKQVSQEIEDCDYILYGHSMGALMCYLVAKRIEKKGLKQPLRLVVSGCAAPSMRKKTEYHRFSSREFWKEVIKLGGVPKEVYKQPQLRNFFEPVLRADFETLATYIYAKKAKLTVPLDVFYGSAEELSRTEVLRWALETLAETKFYELPGGHFFIYEHVYVLVRRFSQIFQIQLAADDKHGA